MICRSVTQAGYNSNCHLPYTGLDLWVVFGIGILFLVLGLVLYLRPHRRSRRSGWPPVRHS